MTHAFAACPGRVRFWLSSVLIALALLAGSVTRAYSSGPYDLRGAAFTLPEGWAVTWTKRDQEYDFASPDGRFQLWARWWFPDEPLLGFGDIERHETRPLAGQEALVIQTETAQERKLTAAFPRRDAQGEQFLWQLIAAPSVPLAEQKALFETLLAGLTLDGQPALGAPAAPAGQAPVPPPAMVPVPPPPGTHGQGAAAPPGAFVPVPPPPTAQGGARPASPVQPGFGMLPLPQPAENAAASGSEPAPGSEPVAPTLLLFDGQSLNGLESFGFEGGDFETHATLTGEGLQFSVPRGAAWARLGVAATASPVTLPAGDSARRVRVAFDGTQSNGFVLAFSPAEAATDDPDRYHVLRLQLFTEKDGLARAKLSVPGEREIVSRQFPWPESRTVFDIVIRGDGVLTLHDETRTELLHLRHDAIFPDTPVVTQIYGRPSYRNGPVELVLYRAVTEEHRFALPESVDAPVTAPVEDETLFTGWALGGLWRPNERREGHFAAFARLQDGALRIAWDKAQRGDYTGIVSTGALFWLDDFRGLAEARLTVEIDAAATGDFEISLGNRHAKEGNLSPPESYVVRFRREADGRFSALSQLRNKDKPVVLTEDLDRLPDRVVLVLRPGRIFVEAEGISTEPLDWPALMDGAALTVSVHAMPDRDGAGALSLWRIARDVHPAQPEPQPQPAPGVALLPERVFFEPPMGPGWQGHSWGKAEFDTLAMATADGLRLTRREPLPDYRRISASGPAPIVALDERIDRAAYGLTLRVDPAGDLGMTLLLAESAPVAPKDAPVALSLRTVETGPDAGGLEVRLTADGTAGNAFARVLPADWWHPRWDGTARLEFGAGWIAVRLAGQVVMRLPSGASGRRTQFLPTVLPGGFDEHSRGAVNLRRIAGGWIGPDGMTESDRWSLVDIEEFDADAFIDMLARDLAEGAR